MAVGEEGVVLKPTPERIKKVTATIDEALRTDEMTPEVAGKLAGRLNFITQATFGALGKAALKPVYSRAHDAAASTSSGLSAGLRAALRALKTLLTDIQPRVIPYIDDGEPQAIIYADAFYQPGETRYKAGHFPAEVPVKPGSKGSNGWGFVVRIGATVFYDCGTAPADFLDLFASRRAFIYVLEILAQVLALVTLRPPAPGPMAGVHRQCRRPMGPDQGLRTRRVNQRRPRSFLVHRGARGMAPGLPACAIQGERLRRRLPRRPGHSREDGMDEGPDTSPVHPQCAGEGRRRHRLRHPWGGGPAA